MNRNILERVTGFLVKLVKDQQFQAQLQNTSVNERKQLLKEFGYSFSKHEFETAAIKLMEAKEQGQLHELSEEELVTVFGGCTPHDTLTTFIDGVIKDAVSGFVPSSHPKTSCMHGPGLGDISNLNDPFNSSAVIPSQTTTKTIFVNPS